MTTELDRNMKGSSRLLLALASLSLLLLYVTPLWKITLDAPQYPEGIGMLIMIDNITGVEKNDLQNINGLNHYIGMKKIEPESIAELKWMPYIIGSIMVLGLAAVASGKRAALYAWTSVFLVVAVVGLVDFYMWEYDYGHNLDLENASIKIPGMTYQPPLIGSKKLLNFTAHSWPGIGGWAAMLSAGIGFVLSLLEIRRVRRSRSSVNATALGSASRDARAGATTATVASVSAAIMLLISGCATGPTPIHYGSDACEHCRMVIAEPRFAMELITSKGKVLKFDAVECAAAYAAHDDAPDELAAWIHLPEDMETWVSAENARFEQSAEIHSPMGAGLAVAPALVGNDITHGVAERANTRMSWTEVVASFAAPRTSGLAQ